VSGFGQAAPPLRVVRQFGVEARAERMPGGQGTSWRAGALVFKPVSDEEEACWLAETLASVVQDGYRLAEPVPTPDGRWVVNGWTAARWVAGDPGPVGHWHELLAATRAFHSAVRHVPRPALLDRRTHWWAKADRSAWGEAAPPPVRALRQLRSRLLHFTRPVTDQPQLVHGDLSGNVLFHERLPPAVLDMSPYWRPQLFAEAIIVADGLLWWGEGAELLSAAGRAGEPSWLARGLLFRLDTVGHQLASEGRKPGDDDLAAFDAALTLLETAYGSTRR
jgi:uncharacterized protein (TIGR02569 family)